MIRHGDTVVLHYALMFEDGEIFDSTFDEDPETIRIGSGELPDALEKRLMLLDEGEASEFVIEAEEAAFGEYDKENKHRLERNLFESFIPDPGALVEFELPGGGWVRGRIENISEQEVMVDFNHPLIGRDVNCKVEILKINHSGVLQ